MKRRAEDLRNLQENNYSGRLKKKKDIKGSEIRAGKKNVVKTSGKWSYWRIRNATVRSFYVWRKIATAKIWIFPHITPQNQGAHRKPYLQHYWNIENHKLQNTSQVEKATMNSIRLLLVFCCCKSVSMDNGGLSEKEEKKEKRIQTGVCPHKNQFVNIYSSFLYNSLKVKTMQIFINWWVNKQISYNGILLINTQKNKTGPWLVLLSGESIGPHTKGLQVQFGSWHVPGG